VFIVVVTPARIAQYSYDKARILASTRFGWLVLAGVMGERCRIISCSIFIVGHSVCVSFPPLIGHTTLVTLCGFAYGMKGFFIGAGASLVGSALAFVILRFLFSEKLHSWSSQNQKWKALESVVVRVVSSNNLTHQD